MAVMIVETSEGTKTIELGLLTRVMLHLDDGYDLTLHAGHDGVELRCPRLNHRLVVRPNAPSSVVVCVEDYV